MLQTEEPLYFDLHLHPSLKGSLSRDTKKYSAWNEVRLWHKSLNVFAYSIVFIINFLLLVIIVPLNLAINYLKCWFYSIFLPTKTCEFKWYILVRPFFYVLKTIKFQQFLNSTANFKRISEGRGFVVVSLIALERAFSKTFVIYWILGFFSPLDRKKLNLLNKGLLTYYDMFRKDLQHLQNAVPETKLNIMKGMNEWKDDCLNIVLSIEGAHSFKEHNENSILVNLLATKNSPLYKFFHLTLTHLTRQDACVHCFGTKVKVEKMNVTPNIDFQPDPNGLGITEIGQFIICNAYAEPNRILIDIKHMSYVSRQQFYVWRKKMDWFDIPLIVSHAGVTGCRLKEAKINCIKKYQNKCDEVFWVPQKSKCGTFFNPWTLNLYDEDIEEVLLSKGLIGIILEERVLGFGGENGVEDGEFMSPLEVNLLNLNTPLQGLPANFPATVNFITDCSQNYQEQFLNNRQPKASPLSFDPRRITSDRIIDFKTKKRTPSHMDYLACNILHILNVGFNLVQRQLLKEEEVTGSVCIGSDLDGLMDPLNFPTKPNGTNINQKKWVTFDKYGILKSELSNSINKCISGYPIVQSKLNIPDFIRQFFHSNGRAFLVKHFP